MKALQAETSDRVQLINGKQGTIAVTVFQEIPDLVSSEEAAVFQLRISGSVDIQWMGGQFLPVLEQIIGTDSCFIQVKEFFHLPDPLIL